MRSYLLAGSFALAALVAPNAVAAKSGVGLQPLTEWKVDFTSERCRLSRQFGTADRPLHLLIDSYGSRQTFRVEFSGNPAPSSNRISGTLSYRLTGDEAFREDIAFLRGTSRNGRALWFSMSFLPAELANPDIEEFNSDEYWAMEAQPETVLPDYEQGVEEITLRLAPSKTMSLVLGEMSQPLADLRLCVDGLIKSWGLDPTQQKGLTRQPIPDTASVAKLQKSYPPEMLKQWRNAFVPIRIMVDVNGAATDCVIQRATVDESFKAAICGNLANRFKPALDANGNPVASVFYTSVIFTMNS
ncbi:hypothetical protein [Altererythrobacter fulvus]|uniref:hypothetical protein n=1 Tax=Caenibius fulvus TaxID=2126012 RepID=UPI003016CE86